MTIGIIGFGQVSKALINQRFVLENLKYIVIRDETDRLNFNSLAQKYNIAIYAEVKQINELADLNLILVNDSNVFEVVTELTKLDNTNLKEPNQSPIFAHFSGALNLDILKPLKENNYNVAKLHPFQTFAILRDNHNIFKDVAFLSEFEVKDFDLGIKLKEFVESLGAKFYNKNELKNFDEKLYHIIAVLSSNYLTTYFKLIIDLAENSGLNKDFLLPIINTTVNNIFENESLKTNSEIDLKKNQFPLSGPIARLDFVTIEKHLEILKNKNINFEKDNNSNGNDLLDFYTFFGKLTAQLGLKNGIFEVGDFDKLKKLFDK